MKDREVCILLNLLSGIGYSKFRALSKHFKNSGELFDASVDELCCVNGINQKLAERIVAKDNKIKYEKEITLVEKVGVSIVTIVDETYPPQLREIPDPPLCLYVRGQLNCDYQKTLAVVGSRRLTVYGREMTDFLVAGLSLSGFTIVSGLAYGVDAVAHQSAVNSEGVTIAVLGGGLLRLHPQDHLQLARSILEKGGAVISEFPMEYPPSRRTFPRRNRVISGLCSGVLVTEAGMKSGALITAGFALEQGRSVFAVPGNANSPMSKGCNQLIRDGAKLTENVDDVFEELEFLPGMSAHGRLDSRSGVVAVDFDDLSDVETKIVECIKLEDKVVDHISLETQLPLGLLLVNLQNLELKKIIVQLPGKRYKLSVNSEDI
jgi:DNA processing protein